MEAVEGNKLKLRRKDGTVIYPAHIEDCIVVPEGAKDYEREPLSALDEGTRPSIGESLEVPYKPLDSPAESKGKLDKMTVGGYVLYATDKPNKNAESASGLAFT